jgi:hypothetical protein
MAGFPVFTGNCPRNVSKDAKYGVGHDKRTRALGVGLTYSTSDDALWHMTTVEHPELMAMVNAVKVQHGDRPHGPFYINEFKQVIVPVGNPVQYYFAGKYEAPLRFRYNGRTISGEPIDQSGKPLQPGDRWTGPHAGIPYVLTATGADIYYKRWPQPEVEQRVKLSTKRGKSTAVQVARLLSLLKGSSGGRFYVNEFCCVFSPVSDGDVLEYLYFGQIDLNCWFPEETSTALVTV